MRYAQIRKTDISNGEGIGVALFTQGCRFHCKNCFNQETWDENGGKEFTLDTENQIIELLKHRKRFSVLGGEPLLEQNISQLTHLLKRVKETYPNIKVWLYTGNTYEDVKDLDLFQYVDVVVDGRYIDELKDLNLEFRGSSNQRIIKLKRE